MRPPVEVKVGTSAWTIDGLRKHDNTSIIIMNMIMMMMMMLIVVVVLKEECQFHCY